MSTEITKDVSCPHCGAVVKTRMWTGISAEVNPNLRTQVLNETLFDWSCPECGYQGRFVYPCLYHDKARKFMVYVVPDNGTSHLNAVDVGSRFPQLDCVKKRVVTTPAALKEKILIFEGGLDDRAVELVKLALAGVIEKKHGQAPEKGYFCFASEAENRIGYSFFLAEQATPLHQGTRLDVYKKSVEIAAAYGGADKSFSAVDQNLAKTLLDTYQAD